jgi:hypothetical protein
MKDLLKLAAIGGALYYFFVYRKKAVPAPPKAKPQLKPTALQDELARNRQIAADYAALEAAPDASDYRTFQNGEPVSMLSQYMSGTNYDTSMILDLEGWD